MLIDLCDGKISITQIENGLSSIHKSQLHYYGFKKISKDEYCTDFESSDQLIQKVITYLTNEKIYFHLSDAYQIRINQISENTEAYAKKITLLRNYKNGLFEKDDYEKFIAFIERNLKRNLLDHQRKAAYHLLLTQNGANFSVPGSGKTSVVLAVYEKLRKDGAVNTLMVVGPTACFGPWQNEFLDTLGRKPECRILAGGELSSRKLEYYSWGDNKGELYLITFQTLFNDIKDAQNFLSNRNVKVFLVIDEAHYIKQIGGEWAKAVLSLAPYASYRCVLTGTPLPKAFSDAFNLFDFLYPDSPPLDSSTKSKIELLEKNKDETRIKFIYEDKIDPLVYRVRKKDLGLIPPIFHLPILISMNSYEKAIYDAIISKIRYYSIDDYLVNIETINKLIRGRIIRLRQCVSYAKLLITAIMDYDEDLLVDENSLGSIIKNYDQLEKPAKLLRLSKIVESMQEQKLKVVIWSNFIETLKLIKTELTANGHKCEIIYGATPIESAPLSEEKTREQIRNEFMEKGSGLDILIANPGACAESISLHKSCYNAIYYDLSYNCAQYLQSLDRIHRVGGSEINQAHYFFLQYADSIDQDILTNLETKAKRMYSLIEKDFNIYSLDMFSHIDDEIDAYRRIFKVKNGL